MRQYNENQHTDTGLPTLNDMGEIPVPEKKANQNHAWNNWVLYWKDECFKSKGFMPEVTPFKDKPMYHKQKKLRGEVEMKRIVEFYLKDEKSNEHLSMTACFSADTINQWRVPKTSGIHIIGKSKT